AKKLLARLEDLPDWGQALVRFHLAARSLSREEFTMAQKLFDEYAQTSVTSDDKWSWAAALQFRANTLGVECEAFNRDFPSVLELQKQGEYEAAFTKL